MSTAPSTTLAEFDERPIGFIAPDLRPTDLELAPRELAPGVYALMATQIPKDNNGLILGDRAALVVDGGVTPTVGRYIQRTAAELTSTPVRYLANTTFHGDHTFGNSAFSDDVVVLTSRANRDAMTDLEVEKSNRAESMYGEDCLDEVTTWRLADVTFDRFLEVDLGGRVVHLWHFGPGNGPGDTIVHVPDARVAWTGNFAMPSGLGAMLLIGDPRTYADTLRTFRDTIDAETLVPGHGFIGPAQPGINTLIEYLEHLVATVVDRAGRVSLDELYDTVPLGPMEPPAETPRPMMDVLESMHRLNILTTYRRCTT